MGIAETGSGKTLAYLLPALVHIAGQPEHQEGDGPIALVLSPTRELACQILEAAEIFAPSMEIKCCCAYGGVPRGPQRAKLKEGV